MCDTPSLSIRRADAAQGVIRAAIRCTVIVVQHATIRARHSRPDESCSRRSVGVGVLDDWGCRHVHGSGVGLVLCDQLGERIVRSLNVVHNASRARRWALSLVMFWTDRGPRTPVAIRRTAESSRPVPDGRDSVVDQSAKNVVNVYAVDGPALVGQCRYLRPGGCM